MTRYRIETPSRLHFGLLSWGSAEARFPRTSGGLGLLIDHPRIVVEAEPAADWSAQGPLAERVTHIAAHVSQQMIEMSQHVQPLSFRIVSAYGEHLGLGCGTQISLAVARLLLASAGLEGPSALDLAELTGRGMRSGVGLHGFVHGGLIVDGGHKPDRSSRIPPLLCRLAFPCDWDVLVVIPESGPGISGRGEVQAFRDLPPIAAHTSSDMAQIVLLQILPSVVERDLPAFQAGLTRLQSLVGESFGPAQGGLFGSRSAAEIAAFLPRLGVGGIGQSSWGPVLYGFAAFSEDQRDRVSAEVRSRFSLAQSRVFWTRARNHGYSLEHIIA